ncbi:MAG: FkbM family methyltransferase [Candidatus Zixiibacteriota bacterium]
MANRNSLGDMLKRLALCYMPDRVLTELKKVHYARALRHQTPDQEPEFLVVSRLVRPGDCVIDIGANIGTYTVLLSTLVGAQGHVFAVEPVPVTFEILCSNIRRLKLQNVTAMSLAVSDHAGRVVMAIPHYPAGGENYYEASVVGSGNGVAPGLRSVEVEAHTLDSLLKAHDKPIQFIKVDVERHELACLRCAVETIASSQPSWLVEVSGDPDDPFAPAHEVMRFMDDHGYQIFWFDGRALRPRQAGDKTTNYFFLTSRHVGVLRDGGLAVAP